MFLYCRECNAIYAKFIVVKTQEYIREQPLTVDQLTPSETLINIHKEAKYKCLRNEKHPVSLVFYRADATQQEIEEVLQLFQGDSLSQIIDLTKLTAEQVIRLHKVFFL